MNQLNGNRGEIAATAKHAATVTPGELAIQLDGQAYDPALTLRVMRRIAMDNKSIAADGERSAEQATMALDVLYRAYQQNSKPTDAGVRTSLDALIQMLQQNPSGYSAPRFAAQMQKGKRRTGSLDHRLSRTTAFRPDAQSSKARAIPGVRLA